MGATSSKPKLTNEQIRLFLTKEFHERILSRQEQLYKNGCTSIYIQDLLTFKKSVFTPSHVYEELKKLIYKPFVHSLVYTWGVHLNISLVTEGTVDRQTPLQT